MDRNFASTRSKPKEGLISTLAIGLFFIIIGIIYITTPGLTQETTRFFNRLILVSVPRVDNLFLPAPQALRDHLLIYSTAQQFSLIWSIVQIFLLVLRFVAKSPLPKKAENTADIVFWFGTTYLISRFLNANLTLSLWFVFWSAILMLIGVSLLVRGLILAVGNMLNRNH